MTDPKYVTTTPGELSKFKIVPIGQAAGEAGAQESDLRAQVEAKLRSAKMKLHDAEDDAIADAKLAARDLTDMRDPEEIYRLRHEVVRGIEMAIPEADELVGEARFEPHQGTEDVRAKVQARLSDARALLEFLKTRNDLDAKAVGDDLLLIWCA